MRLGVIDVGSNTVHLLVVDAYWGAHPLPDFSHKIDLRLAEQLTLALGEPVKHVALTPAQYAALGFPGADDLGNMFQFYQDFDDHFLRTRPVAATRTNGPQTNTPS